MERTTLGRRTGAGFDPCAALQVTLELAPGERAEITCMLGQAESVEEAHKLVQTYREGMALETALEKAKAWWDDLLGTIEVHTPELAADFLINRWLLYQSLSCRIWGRSAFYQSGGAYGFRDQLQAFRRSYTCIPKWRGSTSYSRRAVSSKKAMSNTGGIHRAARESVRRSPMTTCGFPTSSLNTCGPPAMWSSCTRRSPSSTGPYWKAISTRCSSLPKSRLNMPHCLST